MVLLDSYSTTVEGVGSYRANNDGCVVCVEGWSNISLLLISVMRIVERFCFSVNYKNNNGYFAFNEFRNVRRNIKFRFQIHTKHSKYGLCWN